MTRLVAICLVVSLTLVGHSGGRVAWADRREEAHAAEARADSAFERKEYDKALTEYQASYAKSPKPYLLFHIGECYRFLGKMPDAISTYKKYIARVSKGADRKKAVEYISQLDIGPAPKPEAPVVEVPAVQSQDTEAPPIAADEIAKKHREEEERKKRGVGDDAILAQPSNEPLPPGFDPNAHVEIVHSDAPPAHFYPVGYKKPLYRRWWPWTILGVAVAAGVGIGVGVALTRPKFDSELPIGGPGVHALTSSMLVRF
jgi:hypothetical protein